MPPSRKTSLSIAVCLAAVLLLASLGAAGLQAPAQDGTDAAQPQAAGDLALPERVVLSDADTSGSAVIGIDAGAAVDRSGSQLEGAYERYLLEERIAAADTDAERRMAINQSVDDLERRVQELREREDAARQAYRTGEIDAAGYLATLRSVNDRAAQLEQRAYLISPPATQRTNGLAERYGATSAGNRIDPLRGEIITLQGPVRDALSDRMRSDVAPDRFYVTAAPNATVVSYIDESTYYREAIRPNVLSEGDSSGLTLDETIELTNNELYPRFASQYGFSIFSTITSNQIHSVFGERQYEHGSIESYIDAVSENVFWESQQMTLSSDLPRAQPIGNSSENLSVTVRPTYGTGPASVHVVDSGSDVSNATVVVVGKPVAETNQNGTAWVVLPEGTSTVTVTVDGTTARVEVDWARVYS